MKKKCSHCYKTDFLDNLVPSVLSHFCLFCAGLYCFVFVHTVGIPYLLAIVFYYSTLLVLKSQLLAGHFSTANIRMTSSPLEISQIVTLFD